VFFLCCAEVAEQAAWPENHPARRQLTAQAGAFSVLSGSCFTNADGSCLYSDHWNYGRVWNNQRCTIRANHAIDLTVTYWYTEACCDKLQIGSTYYSGSSTPAGVTMNAGSVMYWRTDHSVKYRGWNICAQSRLPPHPTGISNAFSVSSGSCHTNSDRSCFYSPSYPNNYGNSQTCSITVSQNTELDPQAFNTESGYDWLTVNGARYMGTNAPTGVYVSAGSTISWRTDGSVTRTGFAICSGIPATPSPTTAQPTATPTTMHPTSMHPTSMHPTTMSPTTASPTVPPTVSPTLSPSVSPTMHPTTASPTLSPSLSPTLSPSFAPSTSPTKPLLKTELENGELIEDVDLSQVLEGLAPMNLDLPTFNTNSEINATGEVEEVWEPGASESTTASVGPVPSLFLLVCVVGLAVTAMVTIKRRRAASADQYGSPPAPPLRRCFASTTACRWTCSDLRDGGGVFQVDP